MMQRLVFKNTEHVEVDLDKPRITIGRDKGNDVVLEDEGISGFHAEIQLLDDQAYIVDLGSTNGTTVNGKKVTGKQSIGRAVSCCSLMAGLRRRSRSSWVRDTQFGSTNPACGCCSQC
ncbi:MAG TPA: FHA domain-containing protein [Gammaproteobacteria bacterium]|nr:FHA domain-containing protein [Gammaproteobacteria bacterium]